MPVSIKGTGGGGVTLDAGAASTTTTLTLPNVTGTVLQSGTAVTVAQGGTGAATLAANNVLLGNGTSALQVVAPGTTGNLLTSNGTTWTSATPASSGITSGTAVASTSGTSIDFTSLPSTVKRITVMFNGVSTNGSSIIQIQLGYSGGVETTGYVSTAFTSNTNNASSTTGFLLGGASTSSYTRCGNAQICLMGSNLWCFSYSGGVAVIGGGDVGGGNKTVTGTLDRIRITTVGGTDTFDAGSINILYE